MDRDEPVRIARELLARLGGGAGPEEVASLFSPGAVWEIPGDIGALPWLGRQQGRAAAANFVRDSAALLERQRFEVHDILGGDGKAVILGELAARVRATGKLIETAFAVVLTVAGGQITHLHLFEDSFAVAAAARAKPCKAPNR